MVCPHCGGRTSAVIETRAADEATRRRRQCSTCRQRFWTLEAAIGRAPDAVVHQRDLRTVTRLAKDLADTLGKLAGI